MNITETLPTAIWQALLELGASPNYKDSMGLTPLFHLCKKKNSPALCAELLLRDYARLGVKDEQGNTDLHQVSVCLFTVAFPVRQQMARVCLLSCWQRSVKS